VLAGPERVLNLLERGKQWLFTNGNMLVSLVSVALAVYLGWQGIEGLRLG
jgi:predicted negative regulator of RcsB-dependent stress response